MTNLKIKRCGLVNRHNYISNHEITQNPYKLNYEMINYCSNNKLF